MAEFGQPGGVDWGQTAPWETMAGYFAGPFVDIISPYGRLNPFGAIVRNTGTDAQGKSFYDRFRDNMQRPLGPEASSFQHHLRDVLRPLMPEEWQGAERRVHAGWDSYFNQPHQPKVTPPAPPQVSPQDFFQRFGGQQQQSGWGDALKEIMQNRTEGVTVNLLPRESYSDLLPKPPAFVAPNLAGITPPSSTTDFGPARQWMEQAQPKPEEVDPSVMLMSVLGGLAQGASNAGRRVGRTNIVDVLAGAGARGMEGALQGKAYERDVTRRNETARAGYARERGGFEMDAARATSAEDFRNKNAKYSHEMDIGKTAADVINKNAERQYGYDSEKAKMDIAAKQANAPQATVHGSNLVTLEPGEGGTSKYTVKPLPSHDPNAALTRLMILNATGTLPGGGAGGVRGIGGGSGGAKSDAQKAAENIQDEARIRGGAPGSYNSAAHNIAAQIVQNKPWRHDPAFAKINDELINANPSIKKALQAAAMTINAQDKESATDRIMIQLYAEGLLSSQRVRDLVTPYLRPNG